MIYSLLKIYPDNKEYKNVVLGSFDGVHLGHQKVIKSAIENAGKTLVISFDFHRKDRIFPLLQNLQLIQNISSEIDVLTIRLDEINQKVTAIEFIKFLKKFKIENVFIGGDYKFGYKQEGNTKTLKENFNVHTIDFYKKEEVKISSTMIRKYLSEGKIKEANNLLGLNYFVQGIVVKNKQLGRTINFPTINIIPKQDLLKKGVYKSQIIIEDKKYNSITNIGIAPTFNMDQKIMIETHILDEFNEETYGKEVTVFLVDYIREEKKFHNINELQNQLKEDIKLVKGEK